MNIICDDQNNNYFAIIVFVISFTFFRYLTKEDRNKKMKKLENSKKYLNRYQAENEDFFYGDFIIQEKQ